MEYRVWEDLTVLEQYASIYSDMFKDAYGFRPRSNFPETEAEYEEEFTRLEQSIKWRMEEEAAYEKASIGSFEARIANAMRAGNVDRDTAIRWLAEAEDFIGKYDVVSWTYSLGFGGSTYGDELIAKIDAMDIYTEWKPDTEADEDDWFG